MDQEQEFVGRKHKPAKNHPWRNAPKSDVARWAKEKATVAKVNNFKIGQLDKRG